VLLFIILGVIGSILYPPVKPEIQAAAEKISSAPLFSSPLLGDFYLTNTLVSMLIIDAVLIILALAVRGALKKGTLVAGGITAALEMVIELLYNLTESSAGKHAKKIFPWFATITLMVLVSNLMDILPGVDSIGFLHSPEGKGYPIAQLIPGIFTILKGTEVEGGSFVVPWVRVLSTDLNFTVALALCSVFATQVIGVQAQGLRYFSKFINTTHLFDKPFFGAMDFLVGLLELISEFSKILSFAFRLFGVLFAGSVLLFLVGEMVPVFAQSFVLMFEFFIGSIQAIVFGMLTMIFMSMAVRGHGDEEQAEH
jgi:F-type H+-transporting ATPase subunit a